MKKIYTAKVFITLLFGVLAGTQTVYAGTSMKNVPINRSPFYSMNVVAASTFSIEDSESSTYLATFPLSDVVVYPNSATLTMDAAYTGKSSNFGTGGTAAAPNYAVTNVASNITTSFNFGTSDKNYLYFHAPKSQGKVLAISTEHKANTDVYFKTTITLVAGSKTKLELWMGPVENTKCVADFEFNKESQKTKWNISEYQYSSDVVSGSTIVLEIRRANYDEGDDCVFAMDPFYAYSTIDALKVSGTQLVAPIATPVKLTATYKEPVTQQNLHWYEGESMGGYPYFPEITQYTGQNPIELMPPVGTYYYTVTALDQDDFQIASADTLKVERYLECDENSKTVWHEDFGTLDSEDARNSYEGMKYTYASAGNVGDGKYAVTANPRTCGQDNTPVREDADYWFRSIYDHTQGGAKGGSYGGMLLINCQSGVATTDVVLEKDIRADEIGCANSKVWINFSAWFANADWSRGRGEAHPVKMQLCVLDSNGNVIGSVDVASDVNEGWKRGVVSIPYTGGDITLRILNYGEYSDGNGVLIDDIQLEVCRPIVGLKAETMAGKEFDDIKNVSTRVCGAEIVIIADPDNNLQKIYPGDKDACPYFAWLESEDGENWDRVMVDGKEWSGVGNCDGSSIDYSKYSPATIENKPMYYKAVISTSLREIDAYLADPEAHPCSPVVETPSAYVYCPPLRLTLEKEGCNIYEAEVENAKAGHIFKWEYGNDECGWTLIEGRTGSEIKFNAKAYFDKLNGSSNTIGVQDGCCDVGIRVTDTTSGYMVVDYVYDVYVPSLMAELLSQENSVRRYKLNASLVDACYGEEMAWIYEFYKDGKKIDRCDYDYDYEYTTEPLIGGATYTVKFGGEDEIMFCEASVSISANGDIVYDGIIYSVEEQQADNVFNLSQVVSINGKTISVAGIDASDIRIYNTAGKQVPNPVPTTGVYVVKIGTDAVKVVVK